MNTGISTCWHTDQSIAAHVQLVGLWVSSVQNVFFFIIGLSEHQAWYWNKLTTVALLRATLLFSIVIRLIEHQTWNIITTSLDDEICYLLFMQGPLTQKVKSNVQHIKAVTLRVRAVTHFLCLGLNVRRGCVCSGCVLSAVRLSQPLPSASQQPVTLSFCLSSVLVTEPICGPSATQPRK